ncbi:hypothetical protein HK102_006680, partial [Quaeritorhiza haematococci]
MRLSLTSTLILLGTLFSPPPTLAQSTTTTPSSSTPSASSTPSPQLTCFQSPQPPSCADFTYPLSNITSDLNDLCTQMPFMPGCSLKVFCEEAERKGLSEVVNSEGCRPMAVLGAVCAKDMPRMRG